MSRSSFVFRDEPGNRWQQEIAILVPGLDLVGHAIAHHLGTEKVKPLFTRAHLIDTVALKGGMTDAGQEITSADIKAVLQKQNIAESHIKPGDAIMFHTGWDSLWMKNNDRLTPCRYLL